MYGKQRSDPAGVRGTLGLGPQKGPDATPRPRVTLRQDHQRRARGTVERALLNLAISIIWVWVCPVSTDCFSETCFTNFLSLAASQVYPATPECRLDAPSRPR